MITRTPGPSPGRQRRIRSSLKSSDYVNVFPGQDTSKPMGEVVSNSAASRTKISLCPALGGICIGSELFSFSVRIRTAIQNRKNVSNRSAERPCQQRGVPLPSRFRMTSERLNPVLDSDLADLSLRE